MRAVVQRVKKSSVAVDGKIIGSVNTGYNVLLGVAKSDTEAAAKYIAGKIIGLRIFEDDQGKMNKDIIDAGGSILLISQFTLYGDTRGGRRPSFIGAAGYEEGKHLYEMTAKFIEEAGIQVEMGEYGADMSVEIINDGPVTILLDSSKIF